jgi:endo-1,4-beta-xylanase
MPFDSWREIEFADDHDKHAADWAYVVGACKAVSKCVGVTSWGIGDGQSWIPGVFHGQGYGLLWDENYNQKPAYTSVIKALKA